MPPGACTRTTPRTATPDQSRVFPVTGHTPLALDSSRPPAHLGGRPEGAIVKSPQKRLLGAAMATTVAGVLAFSGQAPSFTQAGTESTKPPTVAKDAKGRTDAVAAASD